MREPALGSGAGLGLVMKIDEDEVQVESFLSWLAPCNNCT